MTRRLGYLAGIGLIGSLCGTRAADAGVLPSVLAGAEERVALRFASRGLPYPPQAVAIVALKDAARLEVWADAGAGWRFVRSYLVRAASGRLGPKLREGDHQVPEGVYRIAALNPNSRYHLSLRVDYPNAFDRARAAEDGRDRLGGDIMIHGSNVSDGCLPVGDTAVEELFALVDRVGTANAIAIIAPLDLRRIDPRVAAARAMERPPWLPALYATIAEALRAFGVPRDAVPVVQRTRVARPKCRAYDAADCAGRCGTGDLPSCARAGLMYERGLGVVADTTRAWSFLQKACAGGDALGCAELSRLYVADDGPRRDASRAAELAEAACDGGGGHGCAYLARLCAARIVYSGTRQRCGAERARQLYARAGALLQTDCRGWGAYDCYTLATMYYPSDPHTALRFAVGSCGAGDPGGCYRLGRLREDAGDIVQARELYAQACQKGHTRACRRSGAAPRSITASR